MLFQFPTPLLNIKPAFSLPAVEILNSTTPWQLNVHDSEDAVVAVVEDRNKKNDDDDMSRRRQKRGLSSYLLASCGGTYRYVQEAAEARIEQLPTRLLWWNLQVCPGGGRSAD